MSVKLNNSDNFETPQIFISSGQVYFKLDKENTPIAYQNKINELIEQGAFETQEEAEKWLNDSLFEMEIYYEKGYGLFAVECEAVTSGTIYSPYSGELCEESK